MPKPPESTKSSLSQRLSRPGQRTLARPGRGGRTVPGQLRLRGRPYPGGEVLPLCRLRYGGSASRWGFAIYRASHEDYEPSVLPSGFSAGEPEEALDCACGLYLGDPTAWLPSDPPTN